MKKFSLIIILLTTATYLHAQDVDMATKKSFRHIINLIKQDKVVELSHLVNYPIKLQNPLPDIATAKDFIANYKMLFDDAFKKKLQHYNDTVVFSHNGTYGLVGGGFDGDIWMDEDGKIKAINYNSTQQKLLRTQLTQKIQSQIYPGVNSWDENILVAKSANLLIRLDETKKGIRYVSWSKGKPISNKPDLVLYNGKAEAQGTMGGWTYAFKNGDWTYVIDDVEMCADDDTPKDCGLFIRLIFKGTEKSSVRLKEIK